MVAYYVGGVVLDGVTAETLIKDQEKMLKTLAGNVQKGCKDLEKQLGPNFDVQVMSWTPVHTGLDSIYLLLTIVGKSAASDKGRETF